MQAIVKQTAFVAMIVGAISSEMCASCSCISAGVGMEAMVSAKRGVIFTMQKVIFLEEFQGREKKCAQSGHFKYSYGHLDYGDAQ